MGTFIDQECCGATFGHRATCENWLPSQAYLRTVNAELAARVADLEAVIRDAAYVGLSTDQGRLVYRDGWRIYRRDIVEGEKTVYDDVVKAFKALKGVK